jgi:CRISPR system Cascade subunit CasE
MTLYMHSLQPDLSRLMRFATREHLLPPGDDLGYTFHVALTASFAAVAPKPFVWCAPGTKSGGRLGRLLCYSKSPLAQLVAHSESFADPATHALFDMTSADSKEMPSAFINGARLGFRSRIRPVLRTGKGRDGSGGKERDAYLESPSGINTTQTRSECYTGWLAKQLELGGATLEHATLEAFSLTRIMTRDRSAEKSRRDAPTGPDAVVVGTIVVRDAATFPEFLARGVGRFRAFGFGMLLLAPPKPEPL